MTERRLVFEDFADKVDEVFVIGQDGVPAIPLTLKEAELLPIAEGPRRDAGELGHLADSPLDWLCQRLGRLGRHFGFPHDYTRAGSLADAGFVSAPFPF